MPLYGDIAVRETNLYKSGYWYLGGWVQTRPTIEDLVNLGPLPNINPYLKIVVAWSRAQKDWENNLVYGAGVEVWPLRKVKGLDSRKWIAWVRQYRIYAEYLWINYFKESCAWCPKYDFRIGGELWKAFNVDLTGRIIHWVQPSAYFWAELWFDFGYRKTNFYAKNYNSLYGAAVTRIGVRIPLINALRSKDIFPMVYVGAEHLNSQWTYAWENRLLGIVGLRLMPFQHSQAEMLNQLRIYAEGVKVLNYYCDRPVAGTPDHDFRLGIIFSQSWWSQR